MDIELERKITEITKYLKDISTGSFEFNVLDPVARMMLVALLHESQKIQDSIDRIGYKITEHFCDNFIPRDNVSAMPAIALVAPQFKDGKKSEATYVNSGVSFTYKNHDYKTSIEYIPLFRNTLIPYNREYVITKHRLTSSSESVKDMDNVMWLGINTEAEIESLKNFSFYIQGCANIIPKKITVLSKENTEMQFCSMNRMEDIEMLEPFDAQQASGKLLQIIKYWKEYLQDMPHGALLYITDDTIERDVFKKRPLSESLEMFMDIDVCKDKNTVWIQIEYPKGFVVPEDCSVFLNILPVVNVSVNSVTLTPSSPIAKLQKQEDSIFLQVMETSNNSYKQGYDMTSEEIVIRDFDASCYNNGDLYRDVRNLVNHFVEDYYAFIEYNGMKDGEDIRKLKELINKIAKNAGAANAKYKFDSGTYVMKNINQYSPTLSTKVSYITTQGKLGNLLPVIPIEYKGNNKLECKKLPVIKPSVPVVVEATGGKDKAGADSRYEQLRYYTLTHDRLYTRMDVDAFVRKELACVFDKKELARLTINVSIKGAGGESYVQRGLYVDIEFKDEKNYKKAVEELSLHEILKSRIINKSCISMPVYVVMKSLE